MSIAFKLDPALTIEKQAPCRPSIHQVDQCEDTSGYSSEEFAVLKDLHPRDCLDYYTEGKLPEGVSVNLLDEWAVSWLRVNQTWPLHGFEIYLWEYLGYRRAELALEQRIMDLEGERDSLVALAKGTRDFLVERIYVWPGGEYASAMAVVDQLTLGLKSYERGEES